MENALRPILELTVVIPALFLAYSPMQSYLRQPAGKLIRWALPLLLAIIIGCGAICYRLRASTAVAQVIVTAAAAIIYVRSLRVSLWKSITVALSVCAVFACLNSLTRAIDAAMTMQNAAAENDPWFCMRAVLCDNAMCWIIAAVAHYPATRIVRSMVEDENFAQTWYGFWILPVIFIALNLFMIPKYRQTLYTGRVLQGYVVISLALLILLLWFNAIFLLMANSLNRNARLQQENHLLSMRQARYENLKTAIEDARQARHDMRHQLNRISALAETGDLNALREYLSKVNGRIPDMKMNFCENRAADSVTGYYCALARRESIPFQAQVDLPEHACVDEINLCLALSNLLENALDASLRTEPARRCISLQMHMHAGRILLIQVENAFDGEIHEKDGVYKSAKRKGNGVGLQSVRRIAEKNGGACSFTHQNGVFTAKVMLRGDDQALKNSDGTRNT